MSVPAYEPTPLNDFLIERGFGNLSPADRKLADAIWEHTKNHAAYKKGGVAYEWAKEALEDGANPNLLKWPARMDDLGNTCTDTMLHFMAERGDAEMVELLVSKGADKDAINYRGETPLILAIQNGYHDSKLFETANKLLDLGADPNKGGSNALSDREFPEISVGISQDTALHHAVLKRDKNSGGGKSPMVLKLVKRLVEAGANLD